MSHQIANQLDGILTTTTRALVTRFKTSLIGYTPYHTVSAVAPLSVSLLVLVLVHVIISNHV